MLPRIQQKYRDETVGSLFTEFNYANKMMIPRLVKIVLNTSMSEAVSNVKILNSAAEELTLITGQKSVITRARQSIANFRLREGMPIGAKVTLRGRKMWEFLDRLSSVSIPRIRDFRGLNPKKFDGRGNYTMGITEQIIFPEISYDKIQKINGMNISFVTTAKTDAEALALLKGLGMPFADS
jgi:large subunit ribosomal protein L5